MLVSAELVLATWDVECDGRPALALIDELARLQLAARRLGWSIQVRDAEPAITDMIELAGLSEVLTPSP